MILSGSNLTIRASSRDHRTCSVIIGHVLLTVGHILWLNGMSYNRRTGLIIAGHVLRA